MSIICKCRHCKSVLGTIDQDHFDTIMDQLQRISMSDSIDQFIQIEEHGVASIQVICENCEEALGKYPEYHELDYFLQ